MLVDNINDICVQIYNTLLIFHCSRTVMGRFRGGGGGDSDVFKKKSIIAIQTLEFGIYTIPSDNHEFYVIGVCSNTFVDVNSEDSAGAIKDRGQG